MGCLEPSSEVAAVFPEEDVRRGFANGVEGAVVGGNESVLLFVLSFRAFGFVVYIQEWSEAAGGRRCRCSLRTLSASWSYRIIGAIGLSDSKAAPMSRRCLGPIL